MINFEPNSSSKEELNLLNINAELIIMSLMDIIEEEIPEIYSSSNIIMCADDWLKWFNKGCSDEKVRNIIQEIEDYCK